MKRELAALESNSSSPALDSIWRTTRSSKRFGSSGSSDVFKSLVYKRMKRVDKADKNKLSFSNNGNVNGVVEVSKTTAMEVVTDENGIDDARGEAKKNNGCEIVKVDEAIAMVEEGEKEKENGVVKDLVVPVEVNGGSLQVEESKMVKGVSKKSRLNGKKAFVEGYPRRFTRSALKAKVEGSEENSKEVVNGEVCKEIVLYEPQPIQSNVEVKKSLSVKYTRRRFTRSAAKAKVDESNLCAIVPEPQPIQSNVEVKKSLTEKYTRRRFTRSAAKVDESNFCAMEPEPEPILVLSNEKAIVVATNVECILGDEPKSATPRKKLEMKMSKQISHAKIPTTVQELFETGLLEGCRVYYDVGKGMKLHGRIKGIGILCSCGLCRGSKVIPPSLFEIHACNKYKRAVQYIYLENGRSLINILKTCKSTRLNTLEATVQNAIGPLPEKKSIVCQNCKELFSSMDAESSEPVCSTCVMSNLSPIGPVYSTRKRCRSSKFNIPSRAVLALDMKQDIGRKKSGERSADAILTPRLRSSSKMERLLETKTSEKIAKNSQEASILAKTCSNFIMQKSSEAKHCNKLSKRSFKAALSPKLKSPGSRKVSPGSDSAKATKRLRPTPKPLKTTSALKSSEKKTSGKITRKDLRLHKLVFEDDVLPDGTELGYYARGQKLLDGFKKGSGILCNCCKSVVSASQFEAHAGCASRRKPYCYIYTSNGVSLHELSVTLIKDRRHSAKYNDDLCSICADGGNLLLCDGCPRAFHIECASLSSIPRGKWYCKYCENMFAREKFVAHNANAVAAGRVSGVDSIGQITKRSICIVNNIASEVSACILCRGHDFCKSGFGPRTIILCDQCEKEYHVGCLKDHNMADLTELPDGKWFCSRDCGRIESSLENLLVRGVEKLPESLLDVIQKKNMQNASDGGTNLNVSWRLLSGKIASRETRPLLSQAVAIFHESFAPIIDVVSGHDLIPAMVYGRNVGGQEYSGMYCAVLTANSVVVSAGIFRIFGPEVAELPLVATSSGNHGKGYFQTLFVCIERLLAFLKVKTFVLPAAEEAKSIWTDRFGFKKMTPEQHRELKKNFWSLVRFQGTSMLQKVVPKLCK